MKKRPQVEPPKQQQQSSLINTQEVQQLLAMKAQLKQIKQRNELIEMQAKKIMISNNDKKKTNNGLRQAYQKVKDDFQIINKQHMLKVEQNLKNQQGPLSELVKDNGFGFSPFSLMKIPVFRYEKKQQTDICMACYQQFSQNSKCKTVPSCQHIFHSKCLDQYLLVSKQCPACGKQVII